MRNTMANTTAVNVNLAINCMLLAVFGVGTIEYLIAGVLPQISSDISISESTQDY